MKKRTLTIFLCTLLAITIFTLAACETQQSGDGTPTGTSASVEATTAEATTEATTSGLRPAITAPQGVMTVPPYESVKLPKDHELTLPSEYEDVLCIKHAVYLWKDQFGQDIAWLDTETSPAGACCYGIYNGTAVFYVGSDVFGVTELTVGEETYWNHYAFELWAFKDGKFYSLADAYGAGLLSDKNLGSLQYGHGTIIKKLNSFAMEQLSDREPFVVDAEVDAMLRNTIFEAIGSPKGTSAEELEYRGIVVFDNVYVLMCDMRQTGGLLGSLIVHLDLYGYSFVYGNDIGPFVVYDGEMYGLDDAFAKELLTEEQVRTLYYAQYGKNPPDAE